jgi:hypothetical protein
MLGFVNLSEQDFDVGIFTELLKHLPSYLLHLVVCLDKESVVVFEACMGSNRPPANFALDTVSSLDDCVHLVFATEVYQLFISKLIIVFRAGKLKRKLINREVDRKVNARQESVQDLEVMLSHQDRVCQILLVSLDVWNVKLYLAILVVQSLLDIVY